MLCRVAVLALAIVAAGGCSYDRDVRGPFRGRVVDAATGDPIDGAVVVALWDYGNPFLRLDASIYEAQEVVTGPDGRFEVPRLQGLIGWHNVQQPRLYTFASGYAVGETRITPPGGTPYIDTTVQYMRRVQSRAELCDPARSSIPPLLSSQQAPRYYDVIVRESKALRCGTPDIKEQQQ